MQLVPESGNKYLSYVDKSIQCSVVIPVFNSCGCLEELTNRVDSAFRQIGIGYELILVDDHSSDASWKTIKAIADHGARFAGAMLLHLKDGTRTHFLDFLARELPSLVARYERLYQGAYAPKTYASEVQAVIRMLQDRHGVTPRQSETRGTRWQNDRQEERGQVEQAAFVWSNGNA